jgi:hypothetical protein
MIDSLSGGFSEHELEAYETGVANTLHVIWEKTGKGQALNPVELNTPITALLRRDMVHHANGEWSEVELSEAEQEKAFRDDERVKTLQVLFDFIVADGLQPHHVLGRLFLAMDAASPAHCWGANLSQLADLVGVSKQVLQKRRDKIVLEMMERWFQRRGITAAGGKRASARSVYSELKQGNNSRTGGRRGEELRG